MFIVYSIGISIRYVKKSILISRLIRPYLFDFRSRFKTIRDVCKIIPQTNSCRKITYNNVSYEIRLHQKNRKWNTNKIATSK